MLSFLVLALAGCGGAGGAQTSDADLTLLLGEPPLALSQELVAGRAIPPVPPRVPVGVPSSLVLRRPDIRRAEANLHSAVAEIGVADTDEPALLRAAYNLRSDALMPEEIVAEAVAAEADSAAETATETPPEPTDPEPDR